MLHIVLIRLALLIGIVLSGVFTHAQTNCTNRLAGLVEDENGEPLPGATILIPSLSDGTASDAEGRFQFDNLCPGAFSIVIKFVGYADHNIQVRVPSNRTVVIKLKSVARMLHDVVVQDQHSKNHSFTQALGILTEDQLIQSRGKALGEILEQLPGLQSISTGNSIFKPVIHGLSGQRVLILNNGLRQEGQQWGLEHAPEIDSYIASEIEVVKGSEAVRYGSDALGGAIIISTPKLHLGSGTGGEFHTGFSTNNRGLSFSGNIENGFHKHWAWRAQGTLKKGGDYHAPDYNLSNTGAEEYDLSFAIGYGKGGKSIELYASSFNTTIGILRSAHVGNLNDLQQSITSSQPWFINDFAYEIGNPRQQTGHHLIKLAGSLDVSERAQLRVVYGAQYNQRKEFDVRRGDQSIPSISFDLLTHSVDVTLDHGNGPWSGSVGVTGILKDNFNERSAGLLPDYRQGNIALYALEKWKHNKWLLEGGLRVDKQFFRVWMFDESTLITPAFDVSYFSASAGATYRISDMARINTHAALASRPPHISELFANGLHHSAASIERGLLIQDEGVIIDNTEIKKERSIQWVNTFHYNRGSTFLELTVYANYLRDYVYLSPSGTQLTIRGFFPIFEHRQTDVLMKGADLFFAQNLTRRVSWTSKFSYVSADNREDTGRLPFIPPAQWDNAITYKKEIVGKWKDFFVTGGLAYVFSQDKAPRTVLPGNVTNADLAETFDFMDAPGSYALVRLEAGSTLSVGNKDLLISVGVDNLLNTSYRNYLNRLRYYADEAGRNISLRISYKFHSHD